MTSNARRGYRLVAAVGLILLVGACGSGSGVAATTSPGAANSTVVAASSVAAPPAISTSSGPAASSRTSVPAATSPVGTTSRRRSAPAATRTPSSTVAPVGPASACLLSAATVAAAAGLAVEPGSNARGTGANVCTYTASDSTVVAFVTITIDPRIRFASISEAGLAGTGRHVLARNDPALPRPNFVTGDAADESVRTNMSVVLDKSGYEVIAAIQDPLGHPARPDLRARATALGVAVGAALHLPAQG